jgi:hypothetical protein
MRTLRKLALSVIAALVAASPLLAHHDWPVDRTKLITVTGTVTAFTWADPHVMIALDVRFKDGSNAAQLQKIVMADGREMDLYGQLRVLPAADPTFTDRERRSVTSR